MTNAWISLSVAKRMECQMGTSTTEAWTAKKMKKSGVRAKARKTRQHGHSRQ